MTVNGSEAIGASGAIRPISIVIPTYKREGVLVDTIGYLSALAIRAREIIVVDQTPSGDHNTKTVDALAAFAKQGVIRLILRQPPSITEAMEEGLLAAKEEIVLFVDDDIIPDENLVEGHWNGHERYGAMTVVNGRVSQPWDREDNNESMNPFRFHTVRPLEEIAGGNFSLRVIDWKSVGGFDKHFSRVAYRYEKDFARRFIKAGGRIWLEPDAGIVHLQAREGGTREWGDMVRAPKATPDQCVGQFYFIFCHEPKSRWLLQILGFCRGIMFNRTTLKKPWQLPVHAIALTRGLALAYRQYCLGPRLYSPLTHHSDGDHSPVAPADQPPSE